MRDGILPACEVGRVGFSSCSYCRRYIAIQLHHELTAQRPLLAVCMSIQRPWICGGRWCEAAQSILGMELLTWKREPGPST